MPRDLEGWNKRDRSRLRYSPEKLYEILARIFPKEIAEEYFKQFTGDANLSADIIESDTDWNTILFAYPKESMRTEEEEGDVNGT